MLSTVKKLQSSKQLTYVYFDFTKKPVRVLDPIEDNSTNSIKNFYEKSRRLILEVQESLQ